MTPPWVLALVIAAQFAFAQIGNEDRIAFADKKDSRRAIYRDLYINCQSGAKELYLGSANGSVLLTNGKHIPVRGNSGNYYPEVCGNRAK